MSVADLNKTFTLHPDGPNLWFTSDLHFGHKNILDFCARPFKKAEKPQPITYFMDECLIERWNTTVDDEDHVYILGDLFFCKKSRQVEILKQLKGRKHLVLGNHDEALRKAAVMVGYQGDQAPKIRRDMVEQFESIQDVAMLRVVITDEFEFKNGERLPIHRHVNLIMSHYPLRKWRNAWHLHGHTHGQLPMEKPVKRLDVGVDNPEHGAFYRPISFQEVKETLEG